MSNCQIVKSSIFKFKYLHKTTNTAKMELDKSNVEFERLEDENEINFFVKLMNDQLAFFLRAYSDIVFLHLENESQYPELKKTFDELILKLESDAPSSTYNEEKIKNGKFGALETNFMSIMRRNLDNIMLETCKFQNARKTLQIKDLIEKFETTQDSIKNATVDFDIKRLEGKKRRIN